MMNTLFELWEFMITWYNLPFSLALLAFLGLSLLQFIGLDQDPEADADIDLDHDIDVEADFDHDLEAAEPELEYGGGDIQSWGEVLQFLGVGRVPVTMLLLVLLGGFGIFGWLVNGLILSLFSAYPSWAIAPVSVTALLTGVWTTSRTARFIGRLVPAFTTTATSLERLVGRRGRVVSLQVDQTYGQVRVRDPGGTSITVFAVTDAEQPPVPYDTEIFLVEYDPLKKLFTVEPL
jgi:hypothetical protein